MRKAFILIVLLLVAGCGASVGPITEPEVRAAVLEAFSKLDSGIEREDQFLASSPAAELFHMGNNIAVRYTDAEFSGAGPSALRSLFTTTFALHANILHETSLLDLTLNGEVATVNAQIEFDSLRVDKVPPENFTSNSFDTFVFVLEKGGWKILAWDETPLEEAPEQTEPAQ